MKKLLTAFAVAAALFGSTVSGAVAGVLQSQLGLSGDLEADVVKAKVDGDVLMVAVVFRNTGNSPSKIRYQWSSVYFIDKGEQKKYHVLKDTQGKWIASPLNNDHGRGFFKNLKAGERQMVWFKFPAPPATTQTVDLTLPETLPFDNLPVTR